MFQILCNSLICCIFFPTYEYLLVFFLKDITFSKKKKRGRGIQLDFTKNGENNFFFVVAVLFLVLYHLLVILGVFHYVNADMFFSFSF